MSHALSKRERMEEAELLLQMSREGMTVFDLADALECHHTTAHRYLEEIERGRELIEVKRGHYRLNPTEAVSNVRLKPAEALTIYLALRRFIRQTSKAPDFMITAIQKVIPALQRPDFVEQLTRSNNLLNANRTATREYTQVWDTLIQGWLEGIVVHIHHRKARSNETIEHDIEPCLFEPMPSGDSVYLIAFSQQRKALRTFKLDRIERAILTTQRFEKTDIDVNDLFKCAWGIWYGEAPTRVELIFNPNVAQRLMESVFLPTEKKQFLPDGSVLWTAEVTGLLEILSWVRGWGPEVRVVKPNKLREQIVQDLREALMQYGGGNEDA